MENYQQEYKEFLENYQSGITTGERVGEVIAKMAQRFTETNLTFASALIAYNVKARDIEQTVDETSGKAISSSKAKVMVDGTIEAQTLIVSKANMENVQEIINALKSLQRGIIVEFSHGNLS
jgi:nucleoside diphosphate kinase